MVKVVSDCDEYYECRILNCPDCWGTHDINEVEGY